MSIRQREIACPNCGAKTKITKIHRINYTRSDLRDGHRPPANICKECKYIFFDENFKPNKDFISSSEYLSLYKKYKKYPYYIVYQIYLA